MRKKEKDKKLTWNISVLRSSALWLLDLESNSNCMAINILVFFLLQTKNILVKTDGTCCIADLGLAISRPKPDSKELENIEPKVKRIMTCNFASYR